MFPFKKASFYCYKYIVHYFERNIKKKIIYFRVFFS
nr:MAG TPA: hypothetical protein [Caudoviricetes sp.]